MNNLSTASDSVIRNYVENVGTAILAISGGGEIVFANQRAREWLDLSTEEDSPGNIEKFLGPLGRKLLREKIRSIQESGGQWDGLMTIQCKGKDRRLVRQELSMVQAEDDSSHAILAVSAVDLTPVQQYFRHFLSSAFQNLNEASVALVKNSKNFQDASRSLSFIQKESVHTNAEESLIEEMSDLTEVLEVYALHCRENAERIQPLSIPPAEVDTTLIAAQAIFDLQPLIGKKRLHSELLPLPTAVLNAPELYRALFITFRSIVETLPSQDGYLGIWSPDDKSISIVYQTIDPPSPDSPINGYAYRLLEVFAGSNAYTLTEDVSPELSRITLTPVPRKYVSENGDLTPSRV